MEWIKKERNLLSECGNYKITNSGKRGGNSYVLWGKHNRSPVPDCFCMLILIGSIDECMKKNE